MLDTDTKNKIDAARDILVGKVPIPTSQVEQITIALIYKFMDDMDKGAVQLGGKASFFQGEYKKYSWSSIFDPKISGHELVRLYAEAIEKMNHNPNIPQLFRDIFKNAYLPYKDPETLKSFLKVINEFNYSHSEKLGDAYEYLLSILGSQGDAGQFRTPRHIIDFIVSVVDPKKTDKILDPACGTAGFLISSYKHILNSNKDKKAGDKLKPEERKKLINNFNGYDISPEMVKMSLVNMYLHDFSNPKIYEYDTLTSEERWNEYYDTILANPPFMSPKGGIKPHKKFSIQANRSEILFVDYICEHLTPTGKAGIIVPEGIIFQSNKAYTALRKMLVNKYLWAVVSLPAGIFQPYAGVKTSILLIDKELNKKSKNILFVKIENDGFDLGAQRREIEKNDLPKAYGLLIEYKNSVISNKEVQFNDNNILLVNKEKVAVNDEYNLSLGRYWVDTNIKKSNFQLVKLDELCDIVRGSSPRPKSDPRFYGGTIPRLLISDITRDGMYVEPKSDFLTAAGAKLSRPMKAGDVVLAVSANIGLTSILKVDACIHDGFVGFRNLSNKILPQFLYFCLMNQKSFSGSQSIGAIFKNLTTNQVSEFLIPLPPLSIQQEIVAKIESYQAIINGAKQVVENYNPQIDIDPEWETAELSHLCLKVLSGGTPSTNKPEYWGGKIPWITSADISDHKTINVRKHITQLGLENSTTNLIPKGNIIVVTRVGLGKLAVNALDLCISQDSQGLIVNTAKVNVTYLLFVLLSKVLLFQTTSRGATIQGVTKEQLTSIKIPLPDLNIQQQIVDRIEQEQRLVDANKELIKLYEQKIKDEINKVWEK